MLRKRRSQAEIDGKQARHSVRSSQLSAASVPTGSKKAEPQGRKSSSLGRRESALEKSAPWDSSKQDARPREDAETSSWTWIGSGNPQWQENGQAKTGNGYVGFSVNDLSGTSREAELMSLSIGSQFEFTHARKTYSGVVTTKPAQNSGQIYFRTSGGYPNNLESDVFTVQPPSQDTSQSQLKQTTQEEESEDMSSPSDASRSAHMESDNTCNNCGHANPEKSNFCLSCGFCLLVEVSACRNCGEKLQKNAQFCGSCGMRRNTKVKRQAQGVPLHEVGSSAVSGSDKEAHQGDSQASRPPNHSRSAAATDVSDSKTLQADHAVHQPQQQSLSPTSGHVARVDVAQEQAWEREGRYSFAIPSAEDLDSDIARRHAMIRTKRWLHVQADLGRAGALGARAFSARDRGEWGIKEVGSDAACYPVSGAGIHSDIRYKGAGPPTEFVRVPESFFDFSDEEPDIVAHRRPVGQGDQERQNVKFRRPADQLPSQDGGARNNVNVARLLREIVKERRAGQSRSDVDGFRQPVEAENDRSNGDGFRQSVETEMPLPCQDLEPGTDYARVNEGSDFIEQDELQENRFARDGEDEDTAKEVKAGEDPLELQREKKRKEREAQKLQLREEKRKLQQELQELRQSPQPVTDQVPSKQAAEVDSDAREIRLREKVKLQKEQARLNEVHERAVPPRPPQRRSGKQRISNWFGNTHVMHFQSESGEEFTEGSQDPKEAEEEPSFPEEEHMRGRPQQRSRNDARPIVGEDRKADGSPGSSRRGSGRLSLVVAAAPVVSKQRISEHRRRRSASLERSSQPSGIGQLAATQLQARSLRKGAGNARVKSQPRKPVKSVNGEMVGTKYQRQGATLQTKLDQMTTGFNLIKSRAKSPDREKAVVAEKAEAAQPFDWVSFEANITRIKGLLDWEMEMESVRLEAVTKITTLEDTLDKMIELSRQAKYQDRAARGPNWPLIFRECAEDVAMKRILASSSKAAIRIKRLCASEESMELERLEAVDSLTHGDASSALDRLWKEKTTNHVKDLLDAEASMEMIRLQAVDSLNSGDASSVLDGLYNASLQGRLIPWIHSRNAQASPAVKPDEEAGVADADEWYKVENNAAIQGTDALSRIDAAAAGAKKAVDKQVNQALEDLKGVEAMALAALRHEGGSSPSAFTRHLQGSNTESEKAIVGSLRYLESEIVTAVKRAATAEERAAAAAKTAQEVRKANTELKRRTVANKLLSQNNTSTSRSANDEVDATLALVLGDIESAGMTARNDVDRYARQAFQEVQFAERAAVKMVQKAAMTLSRNASPSTRHASLPIPDDFSRKLLIAHRRAASAESKAREAEDHVRKAEADRSFAEKREKVNALLTKRDFQTRLNAQKKTKAEANLDGSISNALGKIEKAKTNVDDTMERVLKQLEILENVAASSVTDKPGLKVLQRSV